MKYFQILVLLFSFFAVSTAFSQKNATRGDLKLLRFELIDSLSIVKNELVKSKQASLIEKETLTKEIEDSSNTISYLNSVISSFSSIATFLGIFIAILALVMPFATYQFAVKPSRDALKDLEKSFDVRLEKYLWENRNNQINQAIESIKRGNAVEKSQAISYLTFTQSEGLTDNQLFQVYNILRTKLSDNSVKSQLAFILSTRKTDYAAEFFNGSHVSDDPIIRQMAKLKGFGQLENALDKLKTVAEQIRENLDEKREWWDGKSEAWQEGDTGQEWEEHLGNMENILDEIDNLEMPEGE